MTVKPDYAPCEVTLEFGDGMYLFKLPLRQIAELQEKCDAPIGVIYGRVLSGGYKGEDLVETVRLGLVGGGLSGPSARKLIERYCDKWPLEEWHRHAYAVLAACIHGYTSPDDPPEPETQKKSVESSRGSTSRAPTETATPSASASAKSKA